MSSRKPYSGAHRKLVVGIDVGTTFSGVSYSILDPGIIPVIQGVNRYPAQERVGGDAKIPSVMYYDRDGSVRAAGAEVLQEDNAERARDEQWIKAEWFKLHLAPPTSRSHDEDPLPPLPLNKRVEEVFGDFLRYLYQCTRRFIEETHASGSELFSSLQARTEFVLTHPNGWEGAQQAKMRRAAVHAGLIPDTPEGHSLIKFVTEGEASLHYCIGNNFASDVIKSGEGVIILDAGGGTIDLSAFYMSKAPNTFEEIAPATCDFQGSIFVTRRARKFLENKLYASQFGSPEDLDYITNCFDKTTKLSFKDDKQLAYIRFGTSRDNDSSVGIRVGQLKLSGSDVAKLFEPSIQAIEKVIQEQKASACVPVTSVLLVGGFAASHWLFTSLQNRIRSTGLRLFRPDGHLGKAVADGAVSFVLDKFVTMRVARTTFGVKPFTNFQQNDPEHLRRVNTTFTNAAGDRVVPNSYDTILARGTRISESTVFSRQYCRLRAKKSYFNIVSIDIWAYRGNNPNPQWVDVEFESFTKACTVTADIRSAVASLPCLTGSRNEQYFRFDFEIELLFGLTEHKAQICWTENGEKKRGPATIVYDEGVGRA